MKGWVAAAVLLTAAALLVAFGADRPTLALLPVIPVVLFATTLERRSPRQERLVLGVLTLAFAWGAWGAFRIVQFKLREHPEWDFLGFWLHAHSAVQGADFYDPAVAQRATSALSLSPDFRREIVDVGFWYPPPSMFVFLPLGWFDRGAGLVFWYALHLTFLAGAVLWLRKLYFPTSGWPELALCGALAFLSYGTRSTLEFAQTTFLELLLLVGFLARPNSIAGGCLLAAAVFVKPLAIVLVAPLVLRRHVRTLAGFGAFTVAAFLAALLAFGVPVTRHFFSGTGMGEKPIWIYSEPTNQSALGFVLRAFDLDCTGTCELNPWFLAIAAILGGASLALSLRAKDRDEAWHYALWFTLGLIVYPVSQVFYSVLSLPIFLLVWQQRHRLPGAAPAAGAVITAALVLFSVARGELTIFGHLVVWGYLSLILWRAPPGVA